MTDLPRLVKQAVREAGTAILKLQNQGFSVTHKTNNELLTQADLLANDILKSHLMNAYPECGWLSEESVDEKSRLHCRSVWVVDPIDGTKEYAIGIPEYAISVALVEAGNPVLACIFNPAADELFFAEKGKGAWLDDRNLQCDNVATKKLLLLASRSEYSRGEWDRFKDHDIKIIGSIAYKLALVAAGRAHATFSLGPKSEWDIAAGVLLVTEAGGYVSNQHREVFRFNQPNVRVQGIVASAMPVCERVFELIGNTVRVIA